MGLADKGFPSLIDFDNSLGFKFFQCLTKCTRLTPISRKFLRVSEAGLQA